MSKSILEEAIEDAKVLKQTAIENAKNVLVEAITPKIKEFVDSQLGENSMQVEVGPLGGIPAETAMYEKHDDEEEDKALLMQLLGKGLMSKEEIMQALPGGDEDLGGGDGALELPVAALGGGDVDDGQDDLGESVAVTEAEEEEEDEDKMKNESEVVEITQEDIKSAFSEVLGDVMKDLKTEATVTKGFGDAKDVKDGGLMDKEGGEKHWKDEEPPAAKDWTVKEAALKEKVKVLANENLKLKNENTEYKKACDYLRRNLQEVNLFNSKLMYTNKLFQSVDLNHKQRVAIIEQFDNAQSMREVELVYKSLSESLKIAGVVSESRDAKKTMKGPKASRFAAPSSTVLKESLEREESAGEASRWETLAGLVE